MAFFEPLFELCRHLEAMIHDPGLPKWETNAPRWSLHCACTIYLTANGKRGRKRGFRDVRADRRPRSAHPSNGKHRRKREGLINQVEL